MAFRKHFGQSHFISIGRQKKNFRKGGQNRVLTGYHLRGDIYFANPSKEGAKNSMKTALSEVMFSRGKIFAQSAQNSASRWLLVEERFSNCLNYRRNALKYERVTVQNNEIAKN